MQWLSHRPDDGTGGLYGLHGLYDVRWRRQWFLLLLIVLLLLQQRP